MQKYPIILGFATGNPPYRVSQQEAANVAEKAPAVQEVRPLIQRIYGSGRIGFRYMAVPDFTPDQALPGDALFFPPKADGSDHYKVRACASLLFNKKISASCAQECVGACVPL